MMKKLSNLIVVLCLGLALLPQAVLSKDSVPLSSAAAVSNTVQ